MQQPITSKGVKGSKSKGIGQGLYLVTRIAEAMGFTIHFSQQDSTFSVQISL
jgi:sensor histidine kinase regulating citrate/malate metabolism